jgi:hypothetical protein
VLCHYPLQHILLLFAPTLGVKEPVAKSSHIAKGTCPYFLEKLPFNNIARSLSASLLELDLTGVPLKVGVMLE